MCIPSPCGFARAQAALLEDVRCFDKRTLKHVQAIKISLLSGEIITEEPEEMVLEADEEQALCMAISMKKAKDKLPHRVIHGLYIGNMAAARNLKALRKRGITHILNASPVVPCFFKDSSDLGLTYHSIPLFDDSNADLLSHVEAANQFIEEGRKSGGGVLVHCFAGQSRSAALIIAYLMSRQGMDLASAWGKVREARPCAMPNPGFIQQLTNYEERKQQQQRVVASHMSKCSSFENLDKAQLLSTLYDFMSQNLNLVTS